MSIVMRGWLEATAVAWAIMGAIVLAVFADAAVPVDFLIRPIVLSLPVAAVIGAGVALAAPARYRLAGAAAGGASVSHPTAELALIFIAVAILTYLLSNRGHRQQLGPPVLAFAAIFLTLQLIRVLPLVAGSPSPVPLRAPDQPTFLVLLDGYPRLDTLADLGIDNTAFVDALESRGFDHYADAHSRHGWTQLTLLAMLSNKESADNPSSIEEKRAIRNQLALPLGFVAIQPPAGHVVISNAARIDRGGMNDFEAELLGDSALGLLMPDLGRAVVMDGLRERIDEALDLLAATDEDHVFAHLLTPHPPFPDGPACWPACSIFTNAKESQGLTTEEWAVGMQANLDYLNPRLLEAVDRMIVRHPDANIVLFSDHGARYSYDVPDEWHRSFLAARTPGQQGVFSRQPRPDALLRSLAH